MISTKQDPRKMVRRIEYSALFATHLSKIIPHIEIEIFGSKVNRI